MRLGAEAKDVTWGIRAYERAEPCHVPVDQKGSSLEERPRLIEVSLHRLHLHRLVELKDEGVQLVEAQIVGGQASNWLEFTRLQSLFAEFLLPGDLRWCQFLVGSDDALVSHTVEERVLSVGCEFVHKLDCHLPIAKGNDHRRRESVVKVERCPVALGELSREFPEAVLPVRLPSRVNVAGSRALAFLFDAKN